MPLVDMPLKELLTYKGINPCPTDFDEYWTRALTELNIQTLEYTLEEEKSDYKGVILSHLYFTGVGGAKIHCKFLRPANIEGKIPAIAMFHGYQGSCGHWYDKLPYVYNGFVVAAMDVRGQSGLSEDNLQVSGNTVRGQIIRGATDENPDNLFFRNVFLDTAQLVRILQSMDFIDETRVGATGSSQGGALTLACASLEPSVKAIAFAYPFLSDYKRTWEMDLSDIQEPYRELFLHFKREDPLHEKEDEFWTRLGYIDIQNLMPRIKAKSLFFTGLLDKTCPPSTQFAAYNKIGAPKEMKVYPDFAHDVLPKQDDLTLSYFLNNL